jgi:DNA-binding NarL/FixJ family response regulator
VISLYTVKRHVSNILLALDARSRTQAVDRARKLGLLDPEAPE